MPTGILREAIDVGWGASPRAHTVAGSIAIGDELVVAMKLIATNTWTGISVTDNEGHTWVEDYFSDTSDTDYRWFRTTVTTVPTSISANWTGGANERFLGVLFTIQGGLGDGDFEQGVTDNGGVSQSDWQVDYTPSSANAVMLGVADDNITFSNTLGGATYTLETGIATTNVQMNSIYLLDTGSAGLKSVGGDPPSPPRNTPEVSLVVYSAAAAGGATLPLIIQYHG